jgi:membrane protease YdiL (CAAX protease family)
MTNLAMKKVWTFLTLTVLLSAPFYYLIISGGTLSGGGGLYVLGLMWSPGVSALLTRLFFQRNLRGMGWGWGKTGYQVTSYIIPVVGGIAVYGIVWLTGFGEFSSESLTDGVTSSLPIAIGLMATLGVLMSSVFALGEELGWRGLLVPELAKVTSYTKVSLICTVIWAVYHYPVLLFADYSSTAPTWFAFFMFTLSIAGVSFITTWLRLKSGSVWTGVILHASHNLFIQRVFDGLTVDTGNTQYITTEFGAGLALLYVAGGYWCWKHRGSLPHNEPIDEAS